MRFRISNYLVELYGGEPAASDRVVAETFRAQILLFAWGKKKPRAAVRFYDGAIVPADRRDEDGHITMAMPTAMLSNVVDLLRNENPVFLEWKKSQDRPRLTTYLEPVGDGE